MEYPKFKVGTRCFTFNQAPYITDTMNGFTMQKTDFPFVCCIVDDASTDGEQKVILDYVMDNFDLSEGSAYYQKETDYAHITYAKHKTNANCYFVVLLLKENHYSRHELKLQYLKEWMDIVLYEAFCEGDDYWVDENKLQVQYDFLESNAECGMCYTNCNALYQQKGILVHKLLSKNTSQFSLQEFILSRAYVAPPTWMWRRGLLKEPNISIKSMDGTFLYFANFLATTNVHYFNRVTATYRVLNESACHFTDFSKYIKREKNILSVQLALCDYYGLCESSKSNCKQLYYKNTLANYALHDCKELVKEAEKEIYHKSIKDWFLIHIASRSGLLRRALLFLKNAKNHI